MVRLSSTQAVVQTLSTAHDVELLAYTLRRGAVFDQLEAAARRGAHVSVRLEGAPFSDRQGALAKLNRGLVDELTKCGVDARLMHAGPNAADEAPVHAKAIVADGQLFLDDRNWGTSDFVVQDSDRQDVRVVRDAFEGNAHDDPGSVFAIEKPEALAREAELLRSAEPGADVLVSSETFGYGIVYSALDELAKHGTAVRLLVSNREAANGRERKALEHLARDGVAVRLCRDSEKFALVGDSAWLGSANASPAFGHPETLDWGLCTNDSATVAAARERVEARWSTAKPLKVKAAKTTPSRCCS